MGGNTPDKGDEDAPEFGVECNPNGPWANLEDQAVKDAILRATAKVHKVVAAKNPALNEYKTFLDKYTTEWLKFKGIVESEAAQYGFIATKSTSNVEPNDRPKVAVLTLTLSGSYLLLGNGCLTKAGGSAHYQKISFRSRHSESPNEMAPNGVQCTSEPTVKQRLYLQSRNFPIKETSSLQLLFYTTDSISDDDALSIGEMVADKLRDFADETIGPDHNETIQIENPKEIDLPHEIEIPAQEPLEI